MKKWGLLLLALTLMLALAFWFRSRSTDTIAEGEAPRSTPPPATAAMESVASEQAATGSASTQSIDSELLDLTLQPQLSPQAIEEFTSTHHIALDRKVSGHPKSGERLELSWGTSPKTTAVFDVMGAERYTLSAVRSIYPAGSSLAELKAMLKAKVQRPVEHEDDKSLVFASDAQGLTVWLAQNDDETVKVASEYGGHSHP